MNRLELKARAKINITLDILNKREDGYHTVEMIMQTISLCDIISLEKISKGIELSCNKENIPLGEKNIAYKAAKLFFDRYNIDSGIKIGIEKNIPVAAGLAGGSTDAASVLKGMNEIFDINATDEELMILGKLLGADVPYCIVGGTMLSEGIGEILTPLKQFNNINILLIKPEIDVSTQWVYQNLDLKNMGHRPNTKLIIDAIREDREDIVAENMQNVLQSVTCMEYSIIEKIKLAMIENGALGSMMSGSGPSVFGIFKDYNTCYKAYCILKEVYNECYISETFGEVK